MLGTESLTETLGKNVSEGELWEPLEGNRIRCYACGHRCPIPAGFAGVCKVRFNRAGKLYVPWGYVAGTHFDPIEKKPFFHVLPGALAFSFGMLGCSFHCPYCQNWMTSQALRDHLAYAPVERANPEQLVRRALGSRAEVVISTYNEPLITAEWAVAVFKEAKAAGLLTGVVSNGNATPEVLAYLRPWVDLFKVDLKSFSDQRYRRLGARLRPVLESIQQIHSLGFWLEVVTLVVPGFNDSDDELRSIATFLFRVSPDIPWHVTAFQRNYRMAEPEDTSPATLSRAARIGREAGLRYVYAGNLPGAVAEFEDTFCPECRKLLIERSGMETLDYRITRGGCCSGCGHAIPGYWKDPLRRPLVPRAGAWIQRYCG
jgi:pyruvate formate lyase activating enzyme